MNFSDLTANFNKYKEPLLEILINRYGKENSSKIKERLKHVYFDFSSIPEEDWKYLNRHKNEIDMLNKELIEIRYNQFNKVKEESKKIHTKLLMDYIIDKFQVRYFSNDVINTVFSLFSTDDFSNSKIDAFSSKNMDLLKEENISESISESIEKDIKKFYDVADIFGIQFGSLSSETVDEFIQYRKKIYRDYQNYIMQNSRYGIEFQNRINSEFNLSLFSEDLLEMAFENNPYAWNIRISASEKTDLYKIVRIPLIRLLNIGVKGVDVSIVHELIHQIEIDENCINCVGISIHDDVNTNKIMNEIRTQRLAIDVTRELHNLGIFIYDNPNDYKIEGESSYEWLFPITGNFLDKHEELFLDCAFNNTPYKLEDTFEEEWQLYSRYINHIFEVYMNYFTKTNIFPKVDMDDSVKVLIDQMEENYGRRGVKNV